MTAKDIEQHFNTSGKNVVFVFELSDQGTPSKYQKESYLHILQNVKVGRGGASDEKRMGS